jgi:hypothetical protein
LLQAQPESPVTKKTTDGYGHPPLTFLPHRTAFIQQIQISHGIWAFQFLHMPGYPLFNAFSHFAIAGPGEIKVFQKLSKLNIIHRSKLPGLKSLAQKR